jgi:hypothetical protein
MGWGLVGKFIANGKGLINLLYTEFDRTYDKYVNPANESMYWLKALNTRQGSNHFSGNVRNQD